MQMQNERQSAEFGPYLETEYKKQDFITIVKQICCEMQLKIPLYLSDTYEKLFEDKSRVTGGDIIKFVQQLKHQAQCQINFRQQVNYYKEKIYQYKLKDIDGLKKSDFLHDFVEQNRKKGYVTEEIIDKLHNIDMISLKKLEALIDNIEKMMDQTKKIKLPDNKSFIRKSSILLDIQKSNILDNFLSYCQEKIKDPFVYESMENFYEKFKTMEAEIRDEEKSYEKTEQMLRSEIQRQEEIIINYERQIDRKNAELNQFYTKYDGILKQNQSLFSEKIQFMKHIEKLEQQNQKISDEKRALNLKGIELQQELEFYRSNYREVTTQYEQFLEKANQSERKNEWETSEKLFAQRTMKEQLEDAEQKIIQLREERNELRQKNMEIESRYEMRINQLQIDLQQALKQRMKDSMSWFRTSINQLMGGSILLNQQRREDGSTHQLTIVQQEAQQLRKSIWASSSIAFKKTKQEIAFKVQQFLIDLSEQKINENDEIGILNTTELKPILSMIVEENEIKEKMVEQENEKNIQFYSSTGFFIHESGNRFPFSIIIVDGKIAFLDSKCRMSFILKFEQIKKILICYYNVSWIVLKVRENQKNNKSIIIKDMVLSLTNRHQFLQFLVSCRQSLLKHRIKVKVEREENIWLQTLQKESLLSNFANCFNIHRISLSNCKHVFDVQIKDNSLLSFTSNGLLLITKIGILVFESDGPYDMEKKQNLLYLLPILQKMEVIQLRTEKQNQIKLTYEWDKKTYRIKTKSKALTHRLRKKIEQQRDQNIRVKKEELKKFQNLFAKQ